MEIRAMDLIDKEDQNKRIKIVTRFLTEPNEPRRTHGIFCRPLSQN